MLSIFTPESSPSFASESSVRLSVLESTDDFEIVVGRRQMASLSFLGMVLLVLCSGTAYLAGKAAAARSMPAPMVAASPAPAAPISTPAGNPAAVPMAASQPSGINALLAQDSTHPADESVFGEPENGALYIQVGATDRAAAMTLTTSLRTRGFSSLAAPGPSPDVFRVMVGPYKNVQEFQVAKDAINQLGLTAFARTYGE